MRLLLINLDDSLSGQPCFQPEAVPDCARLDVRGMGPGLRLWTTRNRMAAFARAVALAEWRSGQGPSVTFFGSGDYHHLSAPLIAAQPGRFSVVHFDNHPDWVWMAPRYHCGSWVNRALELPQVARMVTIGPCSDDLERPQIKGGNLGALAKGRIELYPWRHAPSRVWGRIGSGAGHRREGGFLHWRNAADENWPALIADILARLPTDAVYVTIDKDVLASEDALSNWDHGQMPLTALLEALTLIAARKRIIAVDVCGEFAPPSFSNPLKRWEARSDQPPPPDSPDLARNARTNAALLTHLAEILS